MNQNRQILHIVLNEFLQDARVLRAAMVGQEVDALVNVFALGTPDLPQHEAVNGIKVRRFQLWSKCLPNQKIVQMGKYGECLVRMAMAGIKMSPFLVHAHDLNALPIGYLIARVTGARLIYDSHELWMETQSINSFPIWLRYIARHIEGVLARRAEQVITVSASIADRLTTSLQVKHIVVVRNVPDLTERDEPTRDRLLLRQKLGIAREEPVILYQGLVGSGRGIEHLIEAISCVRHSSAKLVILGNGPLKQNLQDLVARANISNRVYFYPFVPQQELFLWTCDAEIGIHPMVGSCENHRLALPNKLFEYVHAGLALLVTDLPEMSLFVKTYKVGDVFNDRDPVDIAAKIDALLAEPERLAAHKAASRSAAQSLNWKSEKRKLLAVYSDLFTCEAGS